MKAECIEKQNQLFQKILQRWAEVLAYIKKRTIPITETEFSAYFKKLKPYKLCDDRLYILCDRFEDLYRYENWYRNTIRFAIRQIIDSAEVNPVFITEEMVNTEGIFTIREKTENQIPPRTMNLILKDFCSHMDRCDDLQDRYDILNLIPSCDMQKYLREISYCFSDEERLAIIEDRTYFWEDRKRWLTDFIGTSGDDLLAAYARQYLEATERYLSEFKMASSNDLVYRTVRYYEDGSEKAVLYSYDYEQAYKYGVTVVHRPGQQTEDSFSIEKIRVYGSSSSKYEQGEFEILNFDEVGRLKVPTPFDLDAYDYPDIFEGEIKAPHPFKNGDIVEVLRRYDPEKRYFAVVNDGNPDQYYGNVAYNDFVVFVESYFPNDMEFGHDHISPFDLEFCREPEILEYPSIFEYAQALLTQKRRVTLEEFTMQLHRQGRKEKDGI